MKKIMLLLLALALFAIPMAFAQDQTAAGFQIENIVKDVGLVAAIVIILLLVKDNVNKSLVKAGKPEAAGIIWVIAAGAGGLIAALVTNLVDGFKAFNVAAFIVDAFKYAAASAYLYDLKKNAEPAKQAAP
jgi:hypothetical protein